MVVGHSHTAVLLLLAIGRSVYMQGEDTGGLIITVVNLYRDVCVCVCVCVHVCVCMLCVLCVIFQSFAMQVSHHVSSHSLKVAVCV